jgi:translation initiation factor IF-1
MATQEDPVRGTIQEALPNTMFRVELDNGKKEGNVIIAYLAGKMRLHRIKVLVGDTVEVLIDPYGGKGRIVRRM